MDHSASVTGPDYAADDTLVVDDPVRLRALADVRRVDIVTLLRERARSTTELAELLGLPKGTVGHHVKVLERAGLIRVVRTRRVRAVTEKFYGRVARLFILRGDENVGEPAVAAAVRRAADEIACAEEILGFGSLHVTLTEADARRFSERLGQLIEDHLSRQVEGGVGVGFTAALYRRRGG